MIIYEVHLMRSTLSFSGSLLGFMFCLLASATAQAELPEFTKLIEKSVPAVVKITTSQKTRGRAGGRGDQYQDLPEIYRHLFPRPDTREREAHAMGSGFIIRKDGYILTNNHVVDSADEITVRLHDRREFTAEVIGVDTLSDLALLKIKAKNLPILKLAKAESLKVGQWVVAIGSPFGLDYSASAGIVSAMGRSIGSNNSQYVPFIQTDVAINPGNSGGPLFNLAGLVVGINSQIYSRSGGSNGLSFSIPADVASDVVAQLMDGGRVQRGWLGVVISDVSHDLAISFGLDKPTGALISDVEPGSPADEAGLKPSDIVIKFNGEEVTESGVLPQLVGRVSPDSTAKVTIMRNGKQKNINVTLGERELGEDGLPLPRNKQGSYGLDRLGLKVEPASESGRKQYRGMPTGVVVRQVGRNTPAAATGLRPGDIIVQLGYGEVSNIDDYIEVVNRLPQNKLVPVRFFRQGQPLIRTLRIVD